MCIFKYTNTIYHTSTQIYIVQSKQNIQFHVLYIQTGIGIGCYPSILTLNSLHNQTTELELQPIPFPSLIWNSQSNSILKLNSYIQTQPQGNFFTRIIMGHKVFQKYIQYFESVHVSYVSIRSSWSKTIKHNFQWSQQHNWIS